MDYQNPPYEYITEQNRLEEVITNELAQQKTLALDVEGDGLDPHTMNLILVQIGTPETAYIFHAKLDLAPLKGILEDEKVLKLLQNGKFDYSALKVIKGIEVTNMFDTMLAERILTTGLQRENSLEDLAAKYLGVSLDKDWAALNWIATVRSGRVSKAQLKYAANDVLVLFPLYTKLLAALQREKLMP